MKKLELKYLTGYLPYGLKILRDNKIETVDGINQTSITVNEYFQIYINFNNVKPILRSLSDLNKEIEINGSRFIPLVKMAIRYANSTGYNDKIQMYNEKCYCYSKSSELEFRFDGHDFLLNGRRVQQQYKLFEKLYEWHFDIHGLIENNLAININTL